jgi:DNA modification methylase
LFQSLKIILLYLFPTINANKDTVKNRFNRLTSKEWLPFQKSWFRFKDLGSLYSENIRFFCKADAGQVPVFYYGIQLATMEQQAMANGEILVTDISQAEQVQFAVIDLLDQVNAQTTLEQYTALKEKVLALVSEVFDKLEERRFITVFIPNVQAGTAYYPYAWDLAKTIETVFSLKDEKIACLEENQTDALPEGAYFKPAKKHFYCLYFRKDENAANQPALLETGLFKNIDQQENTRIANQGLPAWFVLKPQPRSKTEILHPAKYPEELVEMFVQEFTQENDNVFDPMSGTGSTQIGAMRSKRNGYGTELSTFFAEIAVGRCANFVNPTQKAMFEEVCIQDFKILNKDARLIETDDFPQVDLIVTSPPYWDMLNMKGAENQAKRVEKGLQTNYSDSQEDMGNIADYNKFIDELCQVYHKLVQQIKPGGYFTIVVKNIKKKGRIYPFAWDLARELQSQLILLPEVFWLQDDISIAPYGYGNTWVSNTFHQYCLVFQKPFES